VRISSRVRRLRAQTVTDASARAGGGGNKGGTAVGGSRFAVLSEEPRQQSQGGFGFGGGRGSSFGWAASPSTPSACLVTAYGAACRLVCLARLEAFATHRQQQQQQQGGRGRGAAAAQPTHWRDVVRSDDAGERPPWRLTCYAHERSGDNDLVGDTSFEELRWSQVQV